MPGKLFIISGPSGVGKGTIIENLLQGSDRLYFSISATTRGKRDYETDGKEYYFVSKADFQDRIKSGRMLEWAEYQGEYYGTPAGPVEEKLEAGFDVILDIETRGMAQVREKRPDAVAMFIYPPAFSMVEQRLTGRGTETAEKIKGRLEKGRSECRKAGDYDYIIINDNLDTAVAEVKAVMTAEKCRTAQRLHILKEDKSL